MFAITAQLAMKMILRIFSQLCISNGADFVTMLQSVNVLEKHKTGDYIPRGVASQFGQGVQGQICRQKGVVT